jgi:succinate dehydrogenase hydrophobic anchor subunit
MLSKEEPQNSSRTRQTVINVVSQLLTVAVIYPFLNSVLHFVRYTDETTYHDKFGSVTNGKGWFAALLGLLCIAIYCLFLGIRYLIRLLAKRWKL